MLRLPGNPPYRPDPMVPAPSSFPSPAPLARQGDRVQGQFQRRPRRTTMALRTVSRNALALLLGLSGCPSPSAPWHLRHLDTYETSPMVVLSRYSTSQLRTRRQLCHTRLNFLCSRARNTVVSNGGCCSSRPAICVVKVGTMTGNVSARRPSRVRFSSNNISPPRSGREGRWSSGAESAHLGS